MLKAILQRVAFLLAIDLYISFENNLALKLIRLQSQILKLTCEKMLT